jgi:membrane associated rhomboid family serine protease
MSTPTAQPRDDRVAGLKVVGVMLFLMWAIEVIDTIDSHRLDQYGIQPRDGDGLAGIVAAPFLHVSFGHLIANSVPFAIMGAAIALGGAARVLLVTIIVGLVSGLGTWLIAPDNTVHLGASGVVFGYATYLISRGVFSRNLLQLVVGVAVVGVWGTVLLGGVQPEEGISWQGHLFGAVGGVVAARVLSERGRRTPSSTGGRALTV